MSNLPYLPTGEELEAQRDWGGIEQYLLDAEQDYPEPHYLLEYGGVGFSPLGGIQAMSGQKKNGKSFVITQLMAAILGAGSERVEQYLGGLKLREDTVEHIGHRPTVLYIDTEMEKLNTAKVLRRVHWLCGWDLKKNSDYFHVLWLRTVEDPKKKMEIVNAAINYYKPTAVFIDGLRDLLTDFNSLDESMPLIAQLMKTATDNNCCIWNVLHMNPRPKNDDESKMRGHLGTELGNKVTDTLSSIKKKEGERVYFTVTQLDNRGKDMPDWQFEIVDDAGVLGIPKILSTPIVKGSSKKVDAEKLLPIVTALREILGTAKSMKWTEIVEELGPRLGLQEKATVNKLKLALDNGIIAHLDNDNKWFIVNEKADEILRNNGLDAPF